MVGPAFMSRCLAHLRYEPTKPTLLCAPYAGGGGGAYADWLPLFTEHGINLVGIRLPGRENRIQEPAHLNLDEMIQEVLNAVVNSPLSNQPLYLFGHSMGAILAFELARRMEWYGHAAVTLLVVSGANPPHTDVHSGRWSHLNDDELLSEIGKLGAIPDELMQHPEYRQIALQILRPDLKAFESYRYESADRLHCPMLVVGGVHDEGISSSSLARWSELTHGTTAVHTYPGGHFFIREQATHLVARILDQIRAGDRHG